MSLTLKFKRGNATAAKYQFYPTSRNKVEYLGIN
jgi:hypothetical protein